MDKENHSNWSLVYNDFIPEQEGLRETLCTLGNGYFATRGAGCEAKADNIHYPGTYLAGGYNRLETEVLGRIIENEDLVNMPNWLCLNYKIDDGEWFSLSAVKILSYRQELDLKKGVLQRKIKFRDAHNRTSVLHEERFIHMQLAHLAAIQWELQPIDWSGKVEICSALDGTVENLGVARYRDLSHSHLDPVREGGEDDGNMLLEIKTSQSDIRVSQGARTKVLYRESSRTIPEKNITKEGYVAQHFVVNVEKGNPLKIEKTVSFYTSKDHSCTECYLEAKNAIINAPSFDELLSSHIHAMDALWHRFNIDIEMESSELEKHPLLILRIHLFHLIQTVSINTLDLDVGVPARGWHGEAYRGHIFWDEIFIFPILNLRMPEITQALLKYRYRRLNEARKRAKEEGFEGAMYPWQSGSNGREESQLLHLNPKSGRWHPDNSSIQRHVNVAIAYSVWRYYEATGNFDFLYSYGAEMILEIARFWASISAYNQDIDRYEIKGVMGPDEYHDAYPNTETPGINNNAYTNLMAVWVIMRAIETLEILPENHRQELCEMLNIQQNEISSWHDISQKMRICFHENGIISQFEGYENLKEFDWDGYRKKYGDIQRLDRILESEGDSANNYKLSKQADVLMLLYLFSYEELAQLFEKLDYPFDKEMIQKNVEYYMTRTSHGSTLSRVVHSWVIMRMMRAESWNLFIQALESDVADIQGGTTPEGIHLGAMAGTVDIIQRCYTGIETRNDVLWFKPHLPEVLNYLHMRLHYRGHSIEVELTQEKLKLSIQRSIVNPIKIGFHNDIFEMKAGDYKEFNLLEKVVNET
ncbi:MAG: glycosyl hydrolase family 65 protein [Chlamydiota bacterium]|nr:glycosyl hydrolase family 65 protein [Chlamydiota bacterium]